MIKTYKTFKKAKLKNFVSLVRFLVRKFKDSCAQIAPLSDFEFDESEGEDNTFLKNLKKLHKLKFDLENVHLASQILLQKLDKTNFEILNYTDQDAFPTAHINIATLISNTVTDKVI